MAKISDLSLDELYDREKITPSVQKAIWLKEDFSKIQPKYCSKVCPLQCKEFEDVALDHRKTDVLVVENFYSLPDRFKSREQIDSINYGIIKYLSDNHLQGLNYRVTNAFKCHITQSDMKLNKPPTESKLLKCSPYLVEEVKRAKPKVIIAMGTLSAKALGIPKVGDFRNFGEIFKIDDGDGGQIPVIVMTHVRVLTYIRQNASGKMWGPDFMYVMKKVFANAGKIARGEMTVRDLDDALAEVRAQIHIPQSETEALEMMTYLHGQPPEKVMSWDLETTSLDPWDPNAKIITSQFGVREADGKIHAYVFPMWHRENTWYDPEAIWPSMKALLEDPNHKKIGWNIKFDLLYTAVVTGVRVKGVLADGMLIEHNINSGIQGCYGLKRNLWLTWPESGLGGYEDKLPKLSKRVVEAESGEGDVDENEADSTDESRVVYVNEDDLLRNALITD